MVSFVSLQQPHQPRRLDACSVALEADLLKIHADGLAKSLVAGGHNLADLAIFVHEIAALSELALVLLVEDLAFPGAVELAVAPGVLRAQLLDAVGELASVFVGTIAFFYKIFAELHLYLVFPSVVAAALGVRRALAFASLEGVALLLGVLLELVAMERCVKCRNGVEGRSVRADFLVPERVELALGCVGGMRRGLPWILGHT